jgi:hypothetical protein
VIVVGRFSVRVILLAALLAVPFGAGCKSGTSATTSSGSGASGKTDSALVSWPKAQEAMKKVAPDAMLLFVGTGGLALADVPDNWGFTFYSPAKSEMYKLSVEGDKVEGPTDLGSTKDAMKSVTQSVDISTIKVGAATAVRNARKFAEKSGKVPQNVMVLGTFATVPDNPTKTKPGFWYVTFASGTDLADAQAYQVDMNSGEVAAVKE